MSTAYRGSKSSCWLPDSESMLSYFLFNRETLFSSLTHKSKSSLPGAGSELMSIQGSAHRSLRVKTKTYRCLCLLRWRSWKSVSSSARISDARPGQKKVMECDRQWAQGLRLGVSNRQPFSEMVNQRKPRARLGPPPDADTSGQDHRAGFWKSPLASFVHRSLRPDLWPSLQMRWLAQPTGPRVGPEEEDVHHPVWASRPDCTTWMFLWI